MMTATQTTNVKAEYRKLVAKEVLAKTRLWFATGYPGVMQQLKDRCRAIDLVEPRDTWDEATWAAFVTFVKKVIHGVA